MLSKVKIRNKRFLKRISADEKGATAIEYGLVISLMVLAIIGGLQAFAGNSEEGFQRTSDLYSEAVNGPLDDLEASRSSEDD